MYVFELLVYCCPLGYSCIFTARKRSFRRLCFYTCLSFCSQGGVCLSACRDTHTPPLADPPGQTHPPRADTPQGQTPPRSRHLESDIPLKSVANTLNANNTILTFIAHILQINYK